MQKLMFIHAVLLVASMYFIQSEGRDLRLQKRSSVRACGRSLSALISVVCQGVYNEPLSVKRSSLMSYDDSEVANRDTKDVESEDFILPMLRNRRGVADECCRKSCSLSTLSSYCGRPPSF